MVDKRVIKVALRVTESYLGIRGEIQVSLILALIHRYCKR